MAALCIPVPIEADNQSQTGSNGCETPPVPVVQFTKTKMCKFEALGICSKGSDCPFAHGDQELKPLPDLRRTKICKALIKLGACQDPTCTYAHSKEELRTIASTSSFKTKMCRFMAENGHCVIGSKCNFAHTPDELRERPLEPVKPAKQTPIKQQRQVRPQQQGVVKMPQHLQKPQQPQQAMNPLLDMSGPGPNMQELSSPLPKKDNTYGQLRAPPGLGCKDDANVGYASTTPMATKPLRRDVGPSPGSPAYIPTAMPHHAPAPPPMDLLGGFDAAAMPMPWLPWGSHGAAGGLGGLPPRHVEELFGSQVRGCGALGYESLFSAGLFGRSLLVDQQDGVLKIQDQIPPLSGKPETMRVPAVRTSSTTLCSLADMPGN